jgi:hypothetical protein
MSVSVSAGAAVFQQDFTAGGSVSDYVGSGTNQFDQITGTISPAPPSGATFSITDNALQVVRTSNAGLITKKGLETGDVAIFQFSVNIISAESNTSPVLNFSAGTNYPLYDQAGGTGSGEPTTTDTFARFGISTTNSSVTPDQWRIRNADVSGSYALGAVGATFSGPQNIFWVLNTSDNAVAYTDPTGASNTVGANTWDLWVGTSLIMTDHVALTATQGFTDFKYRLASGTNIGAQLDNFVVSNVPEPSSLMALGAAAMFLGARRRRRTYE